MSEKRTLEKNKFCNACIKKEKWFSHGYKSSEFISRNIIRIFKSYYHFTGHLRFSEPIPQHFIRNIKWPFLLVA